MLVSLFILRCLALSKTPFLLFIRASREAEGAGHASFGAVDHLIHGSNCLLRHASMVCGREEPELV